MTAAKKTRSGSYVPNALRGTVRIEVRCSEELAARARAVAKEHGCTLADIVDAGLDELARRASQRHSDDKSRGQ